jgi:Flp pilus assembly protein TadD
MYNNWSDHHRKNNNPDRAILYLKQAVSLEPARLEIHRNLARAYSMKGMTAEAELENIISRQLSNGQ